MTDIVIPKYLDLNSMGGRVLDAQQQMLTDIIQKRLPGEGFPPTGVHAGRWSDFVFGLQIIWNIDRDRGMGPQFRERYLAETGHHLLDPYGVNMNGAPTIVYEPDKQFGRWIDGSPNIYGSDNKILETVQTDWRNNGGGDGGVSIARDSYDQIEQLIAKYVKQKPTILVAGGQDTRVSQIRSAWEGKVKQAWNGTVSCLDGQSVLMPNIERLTWAIGGCLIVVRT